MSCPETMALYRSVAGELSKAEADVFAHHLAGCAACTATKAELEGASNELAAALPVDRIWRDAAARPKVIRPAAWRKAVTGVALAAAAAMAMFVLLPGSDELRTKGGLDARLLVLREGRLLEQVTSFCAGDRLQPILRSPAAGRALIYLIDAAGHAERLAPAAAIPADVETEFPSSFTLDADPATEHLLLVVTERSEAEIERQLPPPLDAPAIEGAAVAMWRLDKGCRPR